MFMCAEISSNIKIKYPFHMKAYFHAVDTFHTSCLNTFNSMYGLEVIKAFLLL